MFSKKLILVIFLVAVNQSLVHAGVSLNGLTFNGLTLNGLTLNGLNSINGLSVNGLNSINGLTVNGLRQTTHCDVENPLIGLAADSLTQ